MEENHMGMMEDKLHRMTTGKELKMDDTFKFGCGGCGSCCYNHADIILSGHDIYRIAKMLKIPTHTVVERYGITHIGGDSKMPVVTMGMRADGSCPLLTDGRCIVHDFKPLTCALFPIGRIFNVEKKEVKYVFQTGVNNGCRDIKKVNTLRSWLESFNLHNIDEDSFAWFNSIGKLWTNTFFEGYRKCFDKMTKRTTDLIIQSVAGALYFDYDTDRPYAEQVIERVDDLCNTFDKMKDIFTL
jgi:hypothetical protein